MPELYLLLNNGAMSPACKSSFLQVTLSYPDILSRVRVLLYQQTLPHLRARFRSCPGRCTAVEHIFTIAKVRFFTQTQA